MMAQRIEKQGSTSHKKAGGNLLTLQEQFETEEVSERSPRVVISERAKSILKQQGICTSGFISQEELESERMEQTPQAARIHIIPETSMEISKSHSQCNEGSNEPCTQKKKEDIQILDNFRTEGPNFQTMGARLEPSASQIETIDKAYNGVTQQPQC